ncbi:hypothetical protein AN958_11021 [Leucoagaricus sp. SymC.cos]|nr:hypothetical protein AN958_11021 [Leucoagaricus sp. SymC.cos]
MSSNQVGRQQYKDIDGRDVLDRRGRIIKPDLKEPEFKPPRPGHNIPWPSTLTGLRPEIGTTSGTSQPSELTVIPTGLLVASDLFDSSTLEAITIEATAMAPRARFGSISSQELPELNLPNLGEKRIGNEVSDVEPVVSIVSQLLGWTV